MISLRRTLAKLHPRHQLQNPVMALVTLSSLYMSGLSIACFQDPTRTHALLIYALTATLWFTVLFSLLAETVAETQSRANADSLRRLQTAIIAKKLTDTDPTLPPDPLRAPWVSVPAHMLRIGDRIRVDPEDRIPADSEALWGLASVDESAITGESAPVIRGSGGDFSALTAGTRVLSDSLIASVRVQPGSGFLDRLIQLIEHAERQKTPQEQILSGFLMALTLIVLCVIGSLGVLSAARAAGSATGSALPLYTLVSLCICLIPTTICGLLPAIGVAGIRHMLAARVLARDGKAIETASDIAVLLLDKTGTMTFGNRQASAFYAAPGYTVEALAERAYLSALADETPEGRSILTLAHTQYGILPHRLEPTDTVIPFSAQTRMSGLDRQDPAGTRILRKGAATAIQAHVTRLAGSTPRAVRDQVDTIAKAGGTPLLVSEGPIVYGCIALQDILKPGIRARFEQLRQMGVRTIMLTGDNPVTAVAIAHAAGVDDCLAEATPEDKLRLIRTYQAEGSPVAMAGDGTNDAPALAQADVGIAMYSGTHAAKEAANLVDLDSDPTKLLEIIQTGKRLQVTRGALTTFALANDIAKYFAVLPAILADLDPAFRQYDCLHLQSPQTALLAAVLFNAGILVGLIPLALRGVAYHALSAEQCFQRNLLRYGLSGLLVPFGAIKLIDMSLPCLWL